MAQLQEAVIAVLTGGAFGATGAKILLAKGFTIVGSTVVAKLLADAGIATAAAATAMAPYVVCVAGGVLIGLAAYGTYVYFFRRRREAVSQMNESGDVQNHAAPNSNIAHNGSTVNSNTYLTLINTGNTQGACDKARKDARAVPPEDKAKEIENAQNLRAVVQEFLDELNAS